jgi:hypothetical protein
MTTRVDVLLTEVGIGWRRRAETSLVTAGGERGSGFVEEDDAGVAGLSGWRELLREISAKMMEASARHRGYWWPAISRTKLTGGDGSGSRGGKAAAAIRALEAAL